MNKKQDEFVNIANLFTILRFLLVPFFAYFLYKDEHLIAFCLYAAAGVTDVIDGFIARTFNQITKFGKLADPLADKIMQVTALLILSLKDRRFWYILGIVFIKEALLIVGSIVMYKKMNKVAYSNIYGKFASMVFFIAVILCIFKNPFGMSAMILALLATILAFVMYTRNYIIIKKQR